MKTTDLEEHLEENRDQIENRIEQFRNLKNSDEERWFLELTFVILSSQSKAKEAWEAAQKLEELDLLLNGEKDDIEEVLTKFDISYESSKAGYIIKARKNLSQPTLENPGTGLKLKASIPDNEDKAREWLVDTVPGISWKGASHFMRNIGYSFQFGIASTHTLSVLSEIGLLESAEPLGSKKDYLEFEEEIEKLAEKINVSPGVLDLVLWSKKTGEVFK